MAGVKKIVKEEMILCMGNNSAYLKCPGNRTSSQFYNVWSIFKGNGKSCYCKDCIGKIFDYYLTNGSLQSAIYYTCQTIDVAFISEIYERVNQKSIEDNKAGKKNINYFGTYMTELQRNSTKKEAWNNFSCTNVDLADIDSKIKTNEIKKKELEKFELDWGKKENLEDYVFLEYKYDIYTENKPLVPSQESLYRQLCLVELSKRKKETKNESTKEEQGMMIILMDKLKISNFDEQRGKSDVEKILEKQIWEIENTEPCEVIDKNEYKDFLGISVDWKHILRSLKNILGNNREYPDINNDEWN